MNTSFSLKNLITFIYKIFAWFLPKRAGLRILNYHSVADNSSEIKDIWSLSSYKFETHMSFLQENKKVISPYEIDKSIDDSIIVTFDDAYMSIYNKVLPLMKQLKLPFSIFVITDYVGDPEYLSLEMLMELDKDPLVTIGSHSKSHKRLTKCDQKLLEKEVKGSKDFLEDKLGHNVDFFSYPYGACNDFVSDFVKSSGYIFAFGSKFDINRPSDYSFNLNRCDIWKFDNSNIFEDKLNGYWDWLRFRELLKPWK